MQDNTEPHIPLGFVLSSALGTINYDSNKSRLFLYLWVGKNSDAGVSKERETASTHERAKKEN